jgi:signal transduction histidine kinase
MKQSADRLLRMSSSMLELGVNQHVIRTPRFEHGDIARCIEQAVHEVRLLLNEKHLVLTPTNILPPAAPLYFEPAQIEQVLVNLLENGCKVTPVRGALQIFAYPYFWERRFASGRIGVERRTDDLRSPNSYRIDIKDSGPGILPEEMDRIFEEYACLPSKGAYSTGLGLAICRLIMARHYGRVWSDNVEGGAVFSIVLPHVSPARESLEPSFQATHHTASNQ